VTPLDAAPGDVLAVGGYGGSVWQRLIRIGEVLRGLPGVANHCVIVTHRDKMGRWIGIQGQPGGVGVCDVTPYLSQTTTRSNHAQPKPAPGSPQMTAFLASCAKSLGIQYDWIGIAEDTLGALHLQDLSRFIDPLWRWPTRHGLMPGEVVCSSLAAILYEIADWPHPSLKDERRCEPADWWQWSDQELWKLAPPPGKPDPRAPI
jgi:hypothetical protein